MKKVCSNFHYINNSFFFRSFAAALFYVFSMDYDMVEFSNMDLKWNNNAVLTIMQTISFYSNWISTKSDFNNSKKFSFIQANNSYQPMYSDYIQSRTNKLGLIKF